MAEDPETGERGPRTLTHVWVHGDNLVDFRIADDVVTTTEDHPFWNATDGTWQGLEEFDAGDRVLTADGNLLVTGGLVASSWHTGSAYNLTVQGIHTYYVVVADEAVLVHNTCPDVDLLSASGQVPAQGGLTAAGRAYQKHSGRGQLPSVPGVRLNSSGQDLLDDILTAPGTRVVPIQGGNFAGGSYWIRPDGVAAAFDASGQFRYFGVGMG